MRKDEDDDDDELNDQDGGDAHCSRDTRHTCTLHACLHGWQQKMGARLVACCSCTTLGIVAVFMSGSLQSSHGRLLQHARIKLSSITARRFSTDVCCLRCTFWAAAYCCCMNADRMANLPLQSQRLLLHVYMYAFCFFLHDVRWLVHCDLCCCLCLSVCVCLSHR